MNPNSTSTSSASSASPKQIRIVAIACFAQCDDGTTRKVHLAPGQPRKLHNYVKHNLSGGMIKLGSEPCAIVAATPKKSWWRKRLESAGRKLEEWRQPRPVHDSPVTIH